MPSLQKILAEDKKQKFRKKMETDPVLNEAVKAAEVLFSEMIASSLSSILDEVQKKLEKAAVEVAKNVWSDMQPTVTQEANKVVTNEIADLRKNVKKGDRGDTGSVGPQGPEGKQGVPGKDGRDGKDGKDGKNGKDGVSVVGPKGNDGRDGKPGKDGSPDKPKDIATKLNTLKEVVEQKVIIGLEDDLRLIRRGLKEKHGSGGGMSNVQHETKSVSASTTSVTLNTKVAGGGFAIWAFYQGQMIVRGTHYTISGKTVSLLFTPDNSTAIDFIYFRA